MPLRPRPSLVKTICLSLMVLSALPYALLLVYIGLVIAQAPRDHSGGNALSILVATSAAYALMFVVGLPCLVALVVRHLKEQWRLRWYEVALVAPCVLLLASPVLVWSP